MSLKPMVGGNSSAKKSDLTYVNQVDEKKIVI